MTCPPIQKRTRLTTTTRATTPEDLKELLETAGSATLAWAHAGEVAATPVAFHLQDGRYLVGVPSGVVEANVQATVLVDEGATYFELSGVRVRGHLRAVPANHDDKLEWFEVPPEHVSAWNYGDMRTR